MPLRIDGATMIQMATAIPMTLTTDVTEQAPRDGRSAPNEQGPQDQTHIDDAGGETKG